VGTAQTRSDPQLVSAAYESLKMGHIDPEMQRAMSGLFLFILTVGAIVGAAIIGLIWLLVAIFT
jgi:hypothetical protein